ncbi:MAG: hydrogenase/urease maturation nickel metallochaperone HypA [Gammaproteobacteria bacterium]|jgi:hydrogenase nickel incorporation protein HypA/HybF
MHEASLIRGLINQLSAIAEAENAVRIAAVQVRLGALSHFTREHFAEHFHDAARGSPAEGADLRITVSEDTSDPNAQHVLLEGVEVETREP